MTIPVAARLQARIEHWPLSRPFSISRGTRTEATTLVVEIERGGIIGRGESVPYPRLGETPESALASVKGLADQGLPSGRDELQERLPAGSARNALDCAFWDLEAKTSGMPVWKAAGLPEPRPLVTAYTISLGTPEAMGRQAAEAAKRPLLKIKLGGSAEHEAERIRCVRRNAPESRLVVDANERWSHESMRSLLPVLAESGVELLEQPLPEGADEEVHTGGTSVPLCADESCRTREDLGRLAGRYRYVNVKLDKAGGLTEALALSREARIRGFGVFVGCMMAGSLATAPAFLLAATADYVDLDGPLYLKQDRPGGLRAEGSLLHPPEAGFWG